MESNNRFIYDKLSYILRTYNHPTILENIEYSSHSQNPNLLCKKHMTMPSHSAMKHAQSKSTKDDWNAIMESMVVTEDKNDTDDTSDNNHIWKCAGIGMQPIIEVPELYQSLLTAANKDHSLFYTSIYQGNTGVWYSVLFALDNQFMMRTFTDQQNCVITLKQHMNCELDTHYTNHKYRQYGYSKADMHRALLNQDSYHAFMGHYLSDFMGINIAILSLNGYYWLGRYDPNRITLLMHHQGTDWCALVHADGSSHLFKDISWLEKELTHLDYLDSSKQHLNLSMNKTTLALLKKEIKVMKIKDLQDKAVELELLVNDSNGRKKLKKDLQEEVYIQMTGCESM